MVSAEVIAENKSEGRRGDDRRRTEIEVVY